MLVYGAGLSDGNRHLHEDLPTLVSAMRGGTIQIRPADGVPQGNADVQSATWR